MQPAPVMLALALATCSIAASAADVEFEFDSESFAVKREARQPIPGRMVIVPEMPSYDHPIYEGLWPMTVAAFQDIDSDAARDTELDFPTNGFAHDEDAYLLASNEIQSLRDSLWRATRDKFAAMDNEVVFGHFTR